MARGSYVSDFTRGSVMKQLIIFSLPLFLSNLLQIVYNMVDMVIVGRSLGKVGLSAVSVGGDVSNFLTFVAMGFSNAGQVIIAQYLGAGRSRDVGRFIGTMFAFLGLLALTLGGTALVLRRGVLGIMNTPPESFAQALSYSTICMAGLPFIYGYNAVSAVMRGMGDSKHPFVFISIAALLNVALDLLFVMGLGMGAGGAALATVLSQGVSFVSCAVFTLNRREEFGIEVRAGDFFRLDGAMLRALVGLGVPMAIRSAAISSSKLFVNSWINSYGVAVSAFAGISNKIGSVSNLLSNALITAGSSMVGQNIGAKTYDRVPKVMLSVGTLSFSIATVMAVLLFSFPRQIFSFFTADTEVLAIGLKYLPIGALLFYGAASRAPANALVNGSGNYAANFATAILDGIILRIGLALFFGLTLGMKHYGFWLGDAVAGFTPMFIAAYLLVRGSWKKSKLVK